MPSSSKQNAGFCFSFVFQVYYFVLLIFEVHISAMSAFCSFSEQKTCLKRDCVQCFMLACLILHFPYLILHFPRLILHFPCLILHSAKIRLILHSVNNRNMIHHTIIYKKKKINYKLENRPVHSSTASAD